MHARRVLRFASIAVLVACQSGPQDTEPAARPAADGSARSAAPVRTDSSASPSARRVVEIDHTIPDSAHADRPGASPPGSRATSTARRAPRSRPRSGSAAGSGPGLPLSDSTLIAGFLRTDGGVAPFAAFDGGRWKDVSRSAFEKHASAGPILWHVIPGDGTRLVLRGGRIVDASECSPGYESWVQTTGFRSDTARAGRRCPSKVALALRGSAPVTPLAPVDTAVRRRIVGRIHETFERMEGEELDGLARDSAHEGRTRYGHPVDASERARRPIEVEMLLRAAAPGQDALRLYFFEARRRYASPGADASSGCPSETRVNGFVIEAGERLTVQRPSAGTQGLVNGVCVDSPGRAIRRVRPFGLTEAGGRTFFVAYTSVWEGITPVVYEVARTELREAARGWGR